MIIIKSYSILSNYVGLNKNMGYDKVIKLYINYRTFGSDVKQNNKGTHFFIISYDLIKEKYKTKLEILNFVRDLENNGTICHIVNTNPKYIVETIRLYEEFNNHKLKTIFSNDMSNFFEVVYNDETG